MVYRSVAFDKLKLGVSVTEDGLNKITSSIENGIKRGMERTSSFKKLVISMPEFKEFKEGLADVSTKIGNLIKSLGVNAHVMNILSKAYSIYSDKFINRLRERYEMPTLTLKQVIGSLLGRKGNPLVTYDLQKRRVVPIAGLKGEVLRAGISTAESGLVGALTGIVGLLSIIVKFVMGMVIVRKIMKAIQQVFQVFFIPMALVVLGFLLPFLMLMSSLLKSIDWKKYVSLMMEISKVVTEILKPLFDVLKKNLPEIIKVTTYIGMFIGAMLLAPLLTIMGIIYVFVSVAKMIYSFIKWVSPYVIGFLKWIYSVMKNSYSFLVSILRGIPDFIMNLPSNLLHLLISAMDYLIFKLPSKLAGLFTNLGHDIITGISSMITGGFSSIGQDLSNFFSGKFQTGGIVGRTGIAVVHAGETIIPAGYNSSASRGGMVVNLHVEVHGSNINESVLVDRIIRELENEVASRRRWR